MKYYNWFIRLMGVGLIFTHVYWPNINIDITIISLYFILNIPFIAQYLNEAKIPGAKFVFKENLNETKKLVKQSVENSEKKSSGTNKKLYFETFDLSNTRSLLKSDPVLALANLRIEIEKKLKSSIYHMDLDINNNFSISEAINILNKQNVLSEHQIKALKLIIDMCNKAVHGISISKKEAREIIELTDELNKSFPVGYSIGFFPNENYEEQKLLCEWEHCIERMPLSGESTELSCPVFGHEYPGGVNKVSECNKRIEDIDESRFINS